MGPKDHFEFCVKVVLAPSMETILAQTVDVRARSASRIYLPVGFACVIIALLGFWPSYFGPLLLKGVPHPARIIHVHAAVFMGWLFFLIWQSWLAARGRVALHMEVASTQCHGGSSSFS